MELRIHHSTKIFEIHMWSFYHLHFPCITKHFFLHQNQLAVSPLKKAALFSCLKDKNRERGRNKAKFSIHCLTPQMAAAARAEPKAGAWSASRSPTWLAGALGAPAGSWLSQKPGQDGISDTPKWDRGIPIHTCWPARPIPHHHTWNDNCPETFSKD